MIGKAPMEHVVEIHQIKDVTIRYLPTLSSAMSSKKCLSILASNLILCTSIGFPCHQTRVASTQANASQSLWLEDPGQPFRYPQPASAALHAPCVFNCLSEISIEEIIKESIDSIEVDVFDECSMVKLNHIAAFLGANSSSVIGASSQHALSKCCLVTSPMPSAKGRLSFRSTPM